MGVPYGVSEDRLVGIACPRDSLGVLGTLRIGKTSLLRHIEHLAEPPSEGGYLPLYWNLQGAESAPELSLRLRDDLSDAA
jgi:hypothetical protein